MKLSFVIPAYNEEALIARCLESVGRELARGSYDAEIIVINNASTDRTKEIVLSFPGVKVVDEPKKGLVQARHTGHSAAVGELEAHIDADTQLPLGWVDTVLDVFENNPHLVALSGPYIYKDLSLPKRALVKLFYAVGYLFYFVAHYVLHLGAMLQGGNYVVRREALDTIGGFDTRIAFYGEDTDIAKRLGQVGEVRWTWKLPMYTSGRRLAHEGIVRMGIRYAANFIWVSILDRPYTKGYTDVRS
ncbi:glycosyltransferase family 2 protein [Patescibacteria group bacterium]|nr:glycosyltransferase family 2 protein [Patescibacteria group bacterium]